MTLSSVSRGLACGIVVAMAVWSVGCTASKPSGDATAMNETSAEQEDRTDDDDGHHLNGWWCTEHGVPEKDCSVCSPAAAKRFKEKGDWCEEHGRAKSQCFKCDPSKAEKFAKLYEAKFGKKPPQATD